jgi:hypothetical protein
MATPVLGGVTLPNPSEYEVQEEYRGAGRLMADGTVVYDLYSTTAKHVYTLTWATLTTAQKATVVSAFATVKNSSATMTDFEGNSVTVTRAPDQDTVTFTAVPVANGGVRWRAQITLREV